MGRAKTEMWPKKVILHWHKIYRCGLRGAVLLLLHRFLMDQRQLRTSRRSTLRFIIYAVFIFLAYRLLASFWTNEAEEFQDTYNPPVSNDFPHQPDQKEQVKNMPAPDLATHEETEPKQEFNLPWYPKQTKLSTADRIELELKATKLARDEAQEAFSQFKLEGIPGTAIKTKEEAQAVYSKLDCFTQGSWVYNPTPRELLIHLQESLYSKCDKRYERDHKDTDTSEWKVRNELKYIWTPLDRSQCPLIPVDKSNWCDIMSGRHILLVGDILQFQMHELLLDSFRDGPAVCYGELNCKGKVVVMSFQSHVPWMLKLLSYRSHSLQRTRS